MVFMGGKRRYLYWSTSMTLATVSERFDDHKSSLGHIEYFQIFARAIISINLFHLLFHFLSKLLFAHSLERKRSRLGPHSATCTLHVYQTLSEEKWSQNPYASISLNGSVTFLRPLFGINLIPNAVLGHVGIWVDLHLPCANFSAHPASGFVNENGCLP
ncbi:hypothetical protein P152DRAFT_165986 [Eremomyces bilateralis CBS 781.70]|uniref:Uncharacterized protein n=1 Tax=Eremomyces bilateralis CBS 781.70 TaxID=1392243 RepID=A0A6G1FTK6_9PEZI|nr:uncharacterized protein P152DRAFT_165986 [Eremomyces bilateralis CBS 781.70]KAF1809215.1 hypothetical protein P152DRAFT_165986 [Eremomyces bilateralis CBS 781.70]